MHPAPMQNALINNTCRKNEQLQNGDEAILKDREGRVYRYRVSESFTAWPDDSWVMGQELNRDMLMLQTCIPPNFDKRLIVRADRV